MKTFFIFLSLVFLITSCSNSDDDSSSTTFNLNGEFSYTTPDCIADLQNETTCTDFITFETGNNISFLIGGGDIVEVGTYTIDGNTLTISSESSIIYVFEIKSETEIYFTSVQQTWTKSTE